MKKICHLFCFATVLSLTCSVIANGQLADGYVETWLARRSAKLEAQFKQRTFDSIGWADSIQAALRLATEHKRPVLLFTLNGYMETGRC